MCYKRHNAKGCLFIDLLGSDLAVGDSNELFLDVRQSSMDKNEFYVAPPIKAGGMSPTSCSGNPRSKLIHVHKGWGECLT